MPKQIKKRLASLPFSPGVYKMLDEDGKVLYVGKAKNLKKRVSSYFQKSKNHSIKTEKLIEQIRDIETVETNTELEALILETNFIKELRPKYNILMKDDKNYVYIKITDEDYPQVYLVRKRLKDKARYFGPKTSAGQAKETLKLINKILPFRTCSLDIIATKDGVKVKGSSHKIPCLDYHIKRCLGPCINAISKEEYQLLIKKVVQFLEGKQEDIIKDVKQEMAKLASERHFEKAAKLRDLIEKVERILTKQIVSEATFADRDVIAYVTEKNQAFVNLFQIREGKIINNEHFILNYFEDEDMLSAFLQEYYPEATDIPREILIQEEIKQKKLLKKWLADLVKHKVKILVPRRGTKNHLINLSRKNAESFKKQTVASWEKEKAPVRSGKKGIEELKKHLKLEIIPTRLECYDISHLSGTETTGSMVVFEKGNPKNSDYRRFKIRTLERGEIDDYKALREVLERRLIKLKSELPPPGVTFRNAKKKDLQFIKKTAKKELIDGTDLQAKEFVIAEEKKAIIGFGRIKQYEDKTFELASLWINSKKRGQKLGWKIIKELLQKHKGKLIYLDTGKKIKDYYLDLGFREISNKKNVPEILMKKVYDVCRQNGLKDEEVVFMKYKIPKTSSFDAKPDLIIVDGGKGQLSAATKVVASLEFKIPVIAIAKQEEKIFQPEKELPMHLPENSEALYLMQRIRDEAHRFAITYSKNLRTKNAIKSTLDEIPGIGPKIKKRLLAHFGSVQGLREASPDSIASIAGEGVATKIKEKI